MTSSSAAAESQMGFRNMSILSGREIAEAELTDWRKLAQGLHARYLVDDFGTGARFVSAVGEAGEELGHHPSVSIGKGHVDLKLVSADAIRRDDEGTEQVLDWVTRQDLDLSRRITQIAAAHKVDADPATGHRATRSEMPQGEYRTRGSGPPPSTRPPVRGSTLRSMWRPRWPSSELPPQSPRAGPSSMTAALRRSP